MSEIKMEWNESTFNTKLYDCFSEENFFNCDLLINTDEKTEIHSKKNLFK